MTTIDDRALARDRAADAFATHHECVVRRKNWWASPPSGRTRAEQSAAQRARRKATT